VNMSVWRSVDELADYVFRDPRHRAVLRERRSWFAPPTEAMNALWWVPAGTLPTVADAENRIRHLRRHGPTPFAFGFRSLFPAPGQDAPTAADDWYCPA
jgi:uncharacterized protein DUF3291